MRVWFSLSAACGMCCSEFSVEQQFICGQSVSVSVSVCVCAGAGDGSESVSG